MIIQHKKKDPSILSPCPCGTTPVLTESSGIISKDITRTYKCPKCGLEGEMKWESEEKCRGTWEHTIKMIALRKGRND